MFPPARSRTILLAAMAGLSAAAGPAAAQVPPSQVVGAGGLRLL